jgi:hypothetical protein
MSSGAAQDCPADEDAQNVEKDENHDRDKKRRDARHDLIRHLVRGVRKFTHADY